MSVTDLRAHANWCARQAAHLDLAIDMATEQLVAAAVADTKAGRFGGDDVAAAHGHLADLRGERALWQQLADETNLYLAGVTTEHTDVDQVALALFPAEPAPERT